MSKLLQMPPVHRCAESMCTEDELSYSPRRRPNGPDTMDSIARGVILSVLVGALVVSGFCLWQKFQEAEKAIIQAIGGK